MIKLDQTISTKKTALNGENYGLKNVIYWKLKRSKISIGHEHLHLLEGRIAHAKACLKRHESPFKLLS